MDLKTLLKLTRTTIKLPANDLLVEYLKQTNPDLDDEDIKFEVETRYAYNEDYDDAKEVKSKQIAMKKDLARAKEYLINRKNSTRFLLSQEKALFRKMKKVTTRLSRSIPKRPRKCKSSRWSAQSSLQRRQKKSSTTSSKVLNSMSVRVMYLSNLATQNK